MLKMIKKVGAGFLSVLLLLACFASNATALTFSERFEMCKLAMAHANGTITLDRKEIENIKAQSLLDLEMDFKNLALVPDQDIEIMKKFAPTIFLKYIVPIIEIAKTDLPTEQKVERIIITTNGNCLTVVISLTIVNVILCAIAAVCMVAFLNNDALYMFFGFTMFFFATLIGMGLSILTICFLQ